MPKFECSLINALDPKTFPQKFYTQIIEAATAEEAEQIHREQNPFRSRQGFAGTRHTVPVRD